MAAIIETAKQLAARIGKDEVMMRAAAVAFYAAFSLAPMVLLFVAITGFMGADTQEGMIDTVERTVGASAGEAVSTIAARGQERDTEPGWSLAISIAIILFSASTVVAALQTGLNRVWNVTGAPGVKTSVLGWLRRRVLSMGMVLGICFLLLVSMVATTVIAMVLPTTGWIWNLVNLAISFGVFVLLFAAMFKVLPDVLIGWRHVWFGALVTAALFALGKSIIGMYIGMAGYEDSYGAAGAVVGLLVWVYYSSIIVFLGAEITELHATRGGQQLQPTRHAVRIEVVKEEPAAAREA